MKDLFKKYREIIVYVFFGALTTAISVASYFVLTRFLHLEEILSNTIAWVIAFIFAFVVNKFFVFESRATDWPTLKKEFFAFLAGRLFSLLVDEAIMVVGLKVLHINDMVVQLIKQIAVIVLNYIFSKLIFKKNS